MLTILLYLFHSRRPAGGSLRSREPGLTDSADFTGSLRRVRLYGLFRWRRRRGREFFSALSSFKKSCFRISNNLLEGVRVTGMLFAVRELG